MFLSVANEAVRPSNSLKINPIAVFLPLLEIALLHLLVVGSQTVPSPSPRRLGPTWNGKIPSEAEPSKAPSHVSHTLAACFFM